MSRSISTRRHQKMRVAYMYDDGVGDITYGDSHMMSPLRVRVAHRLIQAYGLESRMDVCRPWRLSEERLCDFHAPEYIAYLRTAKPDTYLADPATPRFIANVYDCPIFPNLLDFCRMSSGASVDAAYQLSQGCADVAINW
jgi:histone deacetylase 1/2